MARGASRSGRPIGPADIPSVIGYEIDEAGNVLYDRPFMLDNESRRKHLASIAPSGGGKSVLWRTIGLADAASGDANSIFLDPQGSDIVDRMLEHFAAIAPTESYIGRLGLIDAGANRISNHNPIFVAPGADPEPIAMSFLARIVTAAGVTGVRWPEHARNIIMALCYSGLDVCPMDVLAFMADAEYRGHVLRAMGDRAPFVAAHFKNYKELSPGERLSWDSPVATKVSPLVGTKFLRRLYRPGAPWDVSGFVDNPPGKIVLCAFRKGVVPKQSAMLASSTIMGDIVAAAFARDAIPESERRPTYLMIDEASHFAEDDALRQASVETRKYRLWLGLAAQSISQIPMDARREIVGNMHYILAGRLGSADAYDIVRESGADDPESVRRRLMRLDAGEMILIEKGRDPRFVKINKDPDRRVDKGAVNALRQIALDNMVAEPVAEIDCRIERRYASLLGLSSPTVAAEPSTVKDNDVANVSPVNPQASVAPPPKPAFDVRSSGRNRSHRRDQGGSHG